MFALADMLIVVGYLVPGLFLLCVVRSQGFIEHLMIDLFQVLLAEGDAQPRPAPVDVGRRERPIVVPDTAPARHAGDRHAHGDHRLSSKLQRERHFGSDVAHASHVTIPSRSLQPLCYFLGEKVTQKHFHTAAPLGRQYESAFARSRGGC